MNKIIKWVLIILGILLVIIVLGNLGKKNQQPVINDGNYTIIEGTYERLLVQGEDSPNGIADPSIVYNNGTGYMSYSGVIIGTGNTIETLGAVSTHLAKTTDNGETWNYIKEINPAYEANITDITGKTYHGMFWNEVSTLVYDSNATGKEWKLFWHKYLRYMEDSSLQAPVMAVSSSISYRYASNPEGEWSDEVILFMGADLVNDIDPKINLKNIDELKDFNLYTEPGALYIDRILYLVLQAHKFEKGKPQKAHIILLNSRDNGETWNYIATLLTEENIEEYRFGKNYLFFTAPALAEEQGKVFLFIAPGRDNKGNLDTHGGTMIFEFEDLSKGKLKTDVNGLPIVYKYITQMGKSGGQAAYDENNTYGKIIMSAKNLDDYPFAFKLYNTKEKII